MSVSMCVCVYVCMCVCIYVCMCVCVYMCVYRDGYALGSVHSVIIIISTTYSRTHHDLP